MPRTAISPSLRSRFDEISARLLEDAARDLTLRWCVVQNPMLLIPHCYQQYMATLAGGRLTKKLVKRSFSLKTIDGINTYEFSVKSRMVIREKSQSMAKHKQRSDSPVVSLIP